MAIGDSTLTSDLENKLAPTNIPPEICSSNLAHNIVHFLERQMNMVKARNHDKLHSYLNNAGVINSQGKVDFSAYFSAPNSSLADMVELSGATPGKPIMEFGEFLQRYTMATALDSVNHVARMGQTPSEDVQNVFENCLPTSFYPVLPTVRNHGRQ